MRFLTLHKLLLAAVPVLALGFAGEASVVTINLDNVLLIDGKRIFPIGFTMPPPLDGLTPEGKNGLQELADAGATFMRTGTQGENWNQATIGREQQWLDAAARHGLYCWPFLRE